MSASDVPVPSIRALNRGCYDSPHSGVGMEFDPLEVAGTGRRLVLHECGFLKGLDWWMFPNTVSPFWRLYYNAIPGHHVVFAGELVPLGADRIVLIPDGNAFDSRGEGPVDHLWMTFSVGYAVRRLGPIVQPVDAAIVAEIQQLAAAFTGVGSGDRFLIYHGCMALLHRLITGLAEHFQPGERSQALARAVAHMRRSFAAPLNIGEVAAVAGLSQRSLSDHFRKEYHCSPGEFLIKLRVGEAASLLTRTDLDVDQIAEGTGFSDRFYLSRVFKRMTGKSPVQYRKSHRRDRIT